MLTTFPIKIAGERYFSDTEERALPEGFNGVNRITIVHGTPEEREEQFKVALESANRSASALALLASRKCEDAEISRWPLNETEEKVQITVRIVA